MNKERIHSLDLLRGFAVLGILIMNIISFSHIGTAYLNPTLGAGLDGVNAWIHGFSYLFADTRFMSIFSILFGAGMVLFAHRMEAKSLSPNKYQYKRLFWLLLFGLVHAYCIWMGDILVAYAICGAWVFLVRNKSARFLWILGSILFLVPFLLTWSNYHFTPTEILSENIAWWNPSEAKIAEEIEIFRGGYLGQFPLRIIGAIELQTIVFFFSIFWRASSMMILGILLYRYNVLQGSRTNSFYKKLFFISFLLGISISGFGLMQNYNHNWSGVYSFNIGSLYNYIASLLMAIGYIGLIMLWSKSQFLNSIKSRFQAAGRMAFTNYIFMSVFCTFIYYGHGLGYFGKMDRLGQMGVVFITWAIILVVSPIYLNKFKQGPLEKLWRKLTYLGAGD